MNVKGGHRVPNDWIKRLRFVPPNRFFWADDPPEGAEVGDRADFKLGDRWWIRTKAGRNINLDDIGRLFRGYQTPADHKPRRERRAPEVINGKWGPDVRRLAEEHGLALSTVYARLREGLDLPSAVSFTQLQYQQWKRDRGLYAERTEPPSTAYRDAAVWVAANNLDRYQPPNSLAGFTRLLMRGYTAKQAILYREGRKDLHLRAVGQADVLARINALRRDLPEIQNRLAQGPLLPGVQVAAEILGVLNMMLGSEGPKEYNPESVYGNALMAVLAARPTKKD